MDFSKLERQRSQVAELYGRTLPLSGLALQAMDVLVFGAVLFFAGLIIVFAPRIHDPWLLLLRLGLWSLFYAASLAWQRRISLPPLRALLRMGSVQLILVPIYLIVHPLQLIFVHNWQDPAILRLENTVFGMQPTLWLQRFVSPGLTEWMMFCYVIYLVIYPALGALIYLRWGEKSLEDYLFTLTLANVICFLGFLVYPVAGPLNHMASEFSVPLKGWLFTAMGEFIRSDVHQVGGNLPSPHCAIATVMWLMAYRYRRLFFWLLTPVILGLYISTVYGRYHYVSDSVIGIATGLLVIGLAPFLVRGWNRLARRGIRETA
ncbi:MAG: phosphatase PAP2 family protein [Candidatus Aminicenantes bacterium]|nr:phosphatase PAP2 family protein [Candidatus Aminicenantes bacterium]